MKVHRFKWYFRIHGTCVYSDPTRNRDLERGFDIVRPEHGEVGTMPAALENYSSKAVKEDDEAAYAPIVVVTKPTFFTE